jgi:murein DD-endopeptidase MepM/ murein hydrolase activator NlpD
LSTRLTATLVAAAVAAPLCCIIPVALLAGMITTCADTRLHAAAADAPDQQRTWDVEQTANAATIITIGVDIHVPRRGWVIAMATAMQESTLRNLGHLGNRNDRDSLGLFQQRPSQGWGTPSQILDPRHAAATFYDKLLTIPHWQSLPLTEAAQKVQASAHPDAYAKWETAATLLVNQLAPAAGQSTTVDLEQCADSCPSVATNPGSQHPSAPPDDAPRCAWVAPVQAPIVSGFRTEDRPGHDGVDLAAARGTPIHAASAGVAVTVRCNVQPVSHGCDQDGSPSTPGCGWYVDLRHEANIHTRYCHMLTRPAVVEGQTVTAGQVIGIVGSSGHSSGPHLHFEVHLGNRSAATATDPVAFMATRAPIGQT